MKELIILLICTIFSLVNDLELKPIGLPDLENNYLIIDKIIENPHTFIYFYTQNKLKYYRIQDTIDCYDFSKLLKDNFQKGYRIIYSEVIVCPIIHSGIIDSTSYLEDQAVHFVQIGSLSTGKRITFEFHSLKNNWTLYEASIFYPHELYPSPDMYAIRLKEKGTIPELEASDNCKLFIKENYQAITDLLNNSDSLYYLFSKILSQKILKKKYDNNISFSDYITKLKKKFIIKEDELFEADSIYKNENITVFNSILITTDYKADDYLKFYFMKKDGIWQFYDRKLENYPDFP